MKRLTTLIALLLALCLLAACTAPATQEAASDSDLPETAVPEDASDSDIPEPPASDSDLPTEDGSENELPIIPADDSPLLQPDGTYQFTRENFPRMDGSTSLVPLGEAVASVLLGERREDVADLVQFNRTTQSYRNLSYDSCDLLLASVPNAAVYDELEEAGFAIESEEICTEALVFMVNENNPVDHLTTQQIQDIYTGKITNWKEVGGNDAPIVAFQRNEGAGSQALMKKLVMDGLEFMEAPKDYIVESMGGLIESVKSYDNSANAIGYTVYYYAHDMEMAKGLKLLSVDGVSPGKDTIRAREYPYLSSYYCVIPASAPEGSPNRVIFDWLMTEEGQKLIAREGYVSILDVE